MNPIKHFAFTALLLRPLAARVRPLLLFCLLVWRLPPVEAAQVDVGFRLDSDWGAGANVTLSLTNNTASAINNWILEFDFTSAISPYSHATLVSRNGAHHVLTNLPYAVIPANGTLSFQCGATPGGFAPAQPTGWLLNGVPAGSGSVTQALQITTALLPVAGAGVAYAQALSASGGTPPYSWVLAGGALPGGLSLSTNGAISGTPASDGVFNFTVQVTDSASPSASTNKALAIPVATLPTLSTSDASLQLAPLTNASGGSNSFFSTSGNQIVDAFGNAVRITGLNWFGFETGNKALHGLWTRGYKEALDQIKGLGFNTLRLPFSNEMLASGAATSGIDFSKNADLQGLTPFQVLDKIIYYSGQIGLRVILDRHSAHADGYMNEDVWFRRDACPTTSASLGRA